MKEMSRKNKSRNRKQDKKSSKIRSLKKYQIQQTPRKRVEYLVDCLHLPTDVVMGREISLLSGNSQMQIRNFKKLLVCKEDEIYNLFIKNPYRSVVYLDIDSCHSVYGVENAEFLKLKYMA